MIRKRDRLFNVSTFLCCAALTVAVFTGGCNRERESEVAYAAAPEQEEVAESNSQQPTEQQSDAEAAKQRMEERWERAAKRAEAAAKAKTEEKDQQASSGEAKESEQATESSTATAEQPQQDQETKKSEPVVAYQNFSRKFGDVLEVKTRLPKEIRSGVDTQLHFTVRNVTEHAIHDVRLIQHLSDSFELQTAKVGDEEAGVPPARNGRRSWSVGEIAPNEEKTLTVMGRASGSEQLHTCTGVEYELTMCQTIPVLTTKLSLDREIIAETEREGGFLYPCDKLRVRYTLKNEGNAPVQGAVIREELPEGVQTANGGRKIAIEAGNMDGGRSFSKEVEIQAGKALSFASTAKVTSDIDDVEAEGKTVELKKPALKLNVQGPEEHRFGRPLEYKVTVRNTSDVPALEATVNIPKPEGVTEIKTQSDQIQKEADTFQLGRIEPHSSKTFTVSVQPEKAGRIAFNAKANAYCAESEVSQELETDVQGLAALQIEVVDGMDPVEVGAETNYEIRLRNEGSAADKQVELTAKLPEQFEFVSGEGETDVRADGQMLRFATIETIEPGQEVTWNVKVKATEAASVHLETRLTSKALQQQIINQEPTTIF